MSNQDPAPAVIPEPTRGSDSQPDPTVAAGSGRTRASSDDSDDASPTVRIRALLPGLARAEQRVANVILADASAVARRSITEVAQAAKTSETTVTRFCKAIGVSGYPALRIALAADAARLDARATPEPGAEIAPEDDMGTVVGKIAYADARAIEDTADQMDATSMERVVEAVSQAERVDIYGVGASSLVAVELQQKLHRIGLISFAWSDSHIMLTSAAVLGHRDVALAVSHSGATTDTVQALRIAGEQGATTIAITNFPGAPISEVAGHVLTTAARETTFRSGDTASRIAQLTIADCLFVGVAQRNRAGTVSTLDATHNALGSHRLNVRHDGRRRPPNTMR